LDPTLDGGRADLEVTGYRAERGVGATSRLDDSPSEFRIGVGFLMLLSSKRAWVFAPIYQVSDLEVMARK
jgi:hypothetical protein